MHTEWRVVPIICALIWTDDTIIHPSTKALRWWVHHANIRCHMTILHLAAYLDNVNQKRKKLQQRSFTSMPWSLLEILEVAKSQERTMKQLDSGVHTKEIPLLTTEHHLIQLGKFQFLCVSFLSNFLDILLFIMNKLVSYFVYLNW